MGKEQSAKYYDLIYSNSKEYKKDYKDSIYFPLWSKMETHLDKNFPVLDLGCGVGQTAKFLIEKDYNYLGIDFSITAIEKAKEEFKNNSHAQFIQSDLFKVDYSMLPDYQLFISETLEHIDYDLSLLQKLKNEINYEKNKTTNIVISVPSFNSKGHVRFFPNEESVNARYKDVINVENCYKFGKFFILHGKI